MDRNLLECIGMYWNVLECIGTYWNATRALHPGSRPSLKSEFSLCALTPVSLWSSPSSHLSSPVKLNLTTKLATLQNNLLPAVGIFDILELLAIIDIDCLTNELKRPDWHSLADI